MRKPARRQPAASRIATKPVAVEVTGVSASAPETEAPYEPKPFYLGEGAQTGRSRLAELRDWLKTVPDNHPYDDLVPLAHRAGWDWFLRQHSVTGAAGVGFMGQNQINGLLIVTFDILIGRLGEDVALFEWVDQASVAVPALAGPVSGVARGQIRPTIVHMLFGRLPPVPNAAPAAPVETSVDLSDGDVDLGAGPDDEIDDDDDLPPEEPVDRTPWTADMANIPVGLPDVVDRYEDGVPVFRDLDDVEAPSVDVIVAVTNAVSEGLLHVKSVEGVLNFFNSNKQVFDWLTEMALPEQRKAIVDAFNRRKGQIEGGFVEVAPRRRNAG